jgi:hypothetical protein
VYFGRYKNEKGSENKMHQRGFLYVSGINDRNVFVISNFYNDQHFELQVKHTIKCFVLRFVILILKLIHD